MSNDGMHHFTGRSATARGGTLRYPVFTQLMNRSPLRTSAISKQTHMQIGLARGFPPSSNGSAQHQDVLSTEILLKTNYSIPQQYRPPRPPEPWPRQTRKHQSNIDTWFKSSETF